MLSGIIIIQCFVMQCNDAILNETENERN